MVDPEHIVVVRSAREQQVGVMSRRTVAIPIDSLTVFTNDVTLEHSLYAAGNADVLREDNI